MILFLVLFIRTTTPHSFFYLDELIPLHFLFEFKILNHGLSEYLVDFTIDPRFLPSYQYIFVFGQPGNYSINDEGLHQLIKLCIFTVFNNCRFVSKSGREAITSDKPSYTIQLCVKAKAAARHNMVS